MYVQLFCEKMAIKPLIGNVFWTDYIFWLMIDPSKIS